ncbi:MAG: hypothetical protein R3195_13840 [Gemmatimonadota bacterium]|nr:hypothetical protein [Gemmatimonadota bacterium]
MRGARFAVAIPLAIAASLGLTAAAATCEASCGNAGATLTGRWTVTISTERGPFDTTWTLEEREDGTLTGETEGRRTPAEIEDGWVREDRFGFNVTREFQEEQFTVTYTGTFTDEVIEGRWSARAGRFGNDFRGVRARGEQE